ncbi:MAG: FKBP-type peptidyl-prolyl cis-trans isomerase [Candidatus Cryptobacteroides sp.]
MKKISFIAAAAAVLAMAASCTSGNNAGVNVEAELPTAAERDSVSYLVGINFGYFIKANNFGEDLNYAEIKKGMMDFIKAEGQPNEPKFNDQFKISPEKMNTLFNNYITKRNNYTAEVNKAKGDKFLEENKMKDGIVVTESGLQYRIIEPGNDVKAGPADTVFVHYTGTLIDGTEFDASDKEKEPVRMLLNRVIKGWTEGLQLVGEGGHIELYVPAELGYGQRNMGKIEPNSTLIFDVEVVKVGKVAEEKK